MDGPHAGPDRGGLGMTTSAIVILAIAAALLIALGFWMSAAIATHHQAAQDRLTAQQATCQAVHETNRLIARLIELEDTKQAQRQSGRDVLRERIKERLAQAAQVKTK